MEKEKGRRSVIESFLPSKLLRKKPHEQRVPQTTLTITRTCDRSNDEPDNWSDFLGHRVCISGIKQGILQFYGRTEFAEGLWCGVVLEEPVGKNDGTVNGVRYFNCKPNHGIFAPVTKVSLLSNQSIFRKQLADESGQRRVKSTFCSYVDEMGDKRNITEQRNGPESYTSNKFSGFENTSLPCHCPVSSNVYSTDAYEKYYQDNKDFNVYQTSNDESTSPPRKVMSDYSLNPKSKKSGLTQSHSCPHPSFSKNVFDYRELDPRFGSGHRQPTFRSYVQSEYDDDDQMSMDFDESLGILTPSEMKDFTLCADLPTSRSDTRALDFPSSESFDEVNDLPEDEQVHDVSVQFIPPGSTSVVHQSVSVAKSNSETFSQIKKDIRQSVGMKHILSTTDKFLSSISSKNDTEEFNFNSGYATSNKDESSGHTLKKVILVEDGNLTDEPEAEMEESFGDIGQLVSQRFDGDAKTRRNYETDSSRDSLLQNEEHTVSKEKLTVSWEDCVADSPDELFNSNNKIERPDSVYTVGSNDTGYQEDGDYEGDTGMTTSVDSSEGKRFSTFSRDSCVVEEDIDGDKVGESTSTSGYSTGLSDSCCNERHEEGMCRPMEDSFQDVVDSCNSDDAMVFVQEKTSSLEKSGGFFDMDSYKDTESTSDFHITESNTILGLDSTCETLSDTVVEEITILEADYNKQMCNGLSQATTIEEISIKASEVQLTNTDQSLAIESIGVYSVTKKDLPDITKKQDLKSPKRNVMSKIKAAIGGNRSKSSETPDGVKKVTTPKKSRWEAVTSKIAASLAEEKTKPKMKREVKSRVDTNLTAAWQTCRSPRMDMSSASEGIGEASLDSSGSSRSRGTATADRQKILNKSRDSKHQVAVSTDHSTNSPRPSKTCSSSRSNSPVAVSESSTSVSLTSHHSRSKIAIWKGSNSTMASSVAPVHLHQTKKLPPNSVLRTVTSVSSRMTTKEMTKGQTAAKIRVNGQFAASPRNSITKTPNNKLKNGKEQSGCQRPIVAPRPVRPPMWLSKAELSQEIQHLSTLCETRTKELNRLKVDTRHVASGFDALAVVITYMSSEMNAFKNPTLATDLKEAQDHLSKGKKDLEYYEEEIEKLNLLHVKEVNSLSERLTNEHEIKVQILIQKQSEQMKIINEQHEKETRVLMEALQASCEEERQQHTKMLVDLQQELKKQREEMEIFHQHELNDLEEMHLEKQKSLASEVEKLQKQCEEAKQLSLNVEDALQKDTDSKLQWLSAKRLDLQNEVDSLKAVLDIKNNELHSLRKENLEMQKELEDLPVAREKIKMLQARAEDLQALMAEKVRLERQISTEHEAMKEVYEREEKLNKRLSMENEELVWKLKQVTESSLLSTSLPDDYETEDVDESIDLASSCPPSVFQAEEPSSPVAKSVASKPRFFTYMNQEELSALPQSPRTQYKGLQPSKSVQKDRLRGPRRSTDSSPHHSEGTPRKVARHVARNTGIRVRTNSGSEEKRARSTAQDSALSSASSENSLFDPCCLHDDQHKAGYREQSSSPHFDLAMMEVNSNEEELCIDFDPKTYYHMTFPVKDSMQDNEMEDPVKDHV